MDKRTDSFLDKELWLKQITAALETHYSAQPLGFMVKIGLFFTFFVKATYR